MGSQGENPQKVLTLGENDSLQNVHWSPDSQRLAYTVTPSAGQGSIQTCDLAGANRTVVVAYDSAFGDDFCWLPDGRVVYSAEESVGSFDGNVWQISVDDHSGRPISRPKRIAEWPGSLVVGLTASADGKRLTFLKMTYQAQVFLGELPAGGSEMSAPRRLTNDEYVDMPMAWTGDSKAVLFCSRGNDTYSIMKQKISQDTAEPVVVASENAHIPQNPRLSPDGASVLYMEIPKAAWLSDQIPVSSGRLMRIPVGGGVPEFVMETRSWYDFSCARAPASLCVIVELSQDKNHLTVTAFDSLKGRREVLRTIDKDPSALNPYAAALSPDGSAVAISKIGEESDIRIRLLSLSGGSDREITLKGWPNLAWNSLYWSPDGKGLYVGSRSPQGKAILNVDLKGNARVLWRFKGVGGPAWGVPSPDGRYLAMENQPLNSNAWMLEGF